MSSHGPKINYHCDAKTSVNAPLIPRISPHLKGQENETIVKSQHPGAIKDGENWVNIPACLRLSLRWGGGGGVKMTGAQRCLPSPRSKLLRGPCNCCSWFIQFRATSTTFVVWQRVALLTHKTWPTADVM